MSLPKVVFNKEEQRSWDLLVEVMAEFTKLEMTLPSHMPDMVDGIHKCQNVLGSRLLQRSHPETWETYKPSLDKKSWERTGK